MTKKSIAPVTMPFDAFEVAACFIAVENDGTEIFCRIDDDVVDHIKRYPKQKIVYTVYGHRPGYGVEAIGDFDSATDAGAMAETLAQTPRDVPVYNMILTSDPEKETDGPRWVLEHELG